MSFKFRGQMYESGQDIGNLDSKSTYVSVSADGTDLSFDRGEKGQYLTNVREGNRYLGQDGEGEGSAQWNLGWGTWVYVQWEKSDGRIQSMGNDNEPTALYLGKEEASDWLIWSTISRHWVKWTQV
jgi:hypothetical protein